MILVGENSTFPKMERRGYFNLKTARETRLLKESFLSSLDMGAAEAAADRSAA